MVKERMGKNREASSTSKKSAASLDPQMTEKTKMCYIHTVEYYSAFKKVEADTCYTTDGLQGCYAECNKRHRRADPL